MSGYKGQRGVNVSQYVQQLNQPSPPQSAFDNPPPSDDEFAAFLNTDFYDINNGSIAEFDPSIDLDASLSTTTIAQQSQPALGNSSRKQSLHTSAEPNMEFNMNGDFQFTDFNNFGANPLLDPSMQGLPQSQPTHYPLPPNYGSPASALSPISHGFDQASKKRKIDDVASVMPQSMDESARIAAEEDKRRRNTAASARFRVKKKQREQALEQTAKEMQDKAARLEQKVQQLETENAWLKGLITEKAGGKHSTTDLKALLSEREAAGRSSPTHTDGVGTGA